MSESHSTAFRFSAEEQAVIAQDYQSGLSLDKVRRKWQCGMGTVQAILKRLVVQTRTRSEAVRKHAIDEAIFQSVDTPEVAYALGFIAADGCVTGNQLVIRLARKDRGHLVNLACALRAEVPIYDRAGVSFGKPCLTSDLVITSEKIVAGLKQHGIPERKSPILEPWDGPAHLMRHWLRGLFDGDGSFSRSGARQGRLVMYGTRAVVGRFQEFATGHAGTHQKKPHFTERDNLWSVYYDSLEEVQAVARLLYADCTIALPRKQAIAERILTLKPFFRDWMHLTHQDLLTLHAQCGGWKKAAAALGMFASQLFIIRKRLGLA